MAKHRRISWQQDDVLPALHTALSTLSDRYPLAADDKSSRSLRLCFTHEPGLQGVRLSRGSNCVNIAYDQIHHGLRGVSAVLGDLIRKGQVIEEQMPFQTFGIMLDCSRNAVMKVEHIKTWLRQLALFGYNVVMLYTEDTYELPGEPYFGYLRGRYTAEELQEIDSYAASLGLEMIGCIQTLGHLEQILRWPAYRNVRDTSSVLLADEPATYTLIDKMVGHFAQVYRSRRIHIGMDETHDLGRGQFMDRFGYKRGFDIFNQHLSRVVDICRKHGLSPMIWSDMYFRMGSKTGEYYDRDAKIPTDVAKAIPADVQLVYWDYYHEDQAFYRDHIERHRALGKEPVMAGGVWTWALPWHDFDHTRRTAQPCVEACRERKVSELLFTMWGDDGAYCEFDSAMTGLAYVADMVYGCDTADDKNLARRFAAVCGADYRTVVDAAGLAHGSMHRLLWDDPLLRIRWTEMNKTTAEWKRLLKHCRQLTIRLTRVARQTTPIDLAHAANLARYLALKIELALELDAAHAAKGTAALTAVRRKIPQMTKCIDRLLVSFRRQWYRRNKPFGFEGIQTRLAGLQCRYLELADRLDELIRGKISSIDELEDGSALDRNRVE